MAWTYAGPTTDAGKVRYLIGDVTAGSTSVSFPTLSDAEVAYELTRSGSVEKSAALAARSLAAQFARQPTNKKVGDLSITWGDRAKELRATADSLEDSAGLAAVPIAGGISVADKQAEEDRTDRVPPSFTRGMDDDPSVTWPDSADTRPAVGY